MDVLVFNAGQREQEVRDLKRDISDMARHIQRMNGDLEALLRKVRLANAPRMCQAHISSIKQTSEREIFLSGRGLEEGNQ